MNPHSVRVPGKVMLSGEYAVLHGGTAVLLPVNRFLEVRETGKAEALPPAAAAAFEQPIPEERDTKPLLGVQIEREEFFTENAAGELRKLGLGGSAAETVGVIALRFERMGLPWREHRRRIAEIADEAHRRAQGGRGSGADVWACALGIPITFRLGLSGPDVETIDASVEAYRVPLHLAWTGESANTRDLVDRFESWLADDPFADGELARLIDASDELARHWLRSPLEELLDPFDAFVARMAEIARAAQIPWKLPVHEELDEWARSRGGRAKPTGAGGGDLVLLVGELPLKELDDRLVVPIWPLPEPLQQ